MNIHQDWLDHPMVRRAASQTDSTLDMLVELHDMCTELEARYPGLGFGEILSQPVEDRSPFAYQQALVSQVFALHAEGFTNRAIARALDNQVSYTTVNRWLSGNVPPGCVTPTGYRVEKRTPKYQLVAEWAAEHGTKSAVERFGCTKQFVYKSVNLAKDRGLL